MPLWKPDVLDNLQFWVRGDSLQNQTSGSDITFWADESGNGFHVEKDGSVNAPDVVLEAQNDLPAADFLGSNTEVLWGPANVAEFGTDPFFITGVFKTVTSGAEAETVFADNLSGSEFEFRYTASSNRPIKYFGSDSTAHSVAVNAGVNVTMAGYDRTQTVSAGGVAKWYVQGELESTEAEGGTYADTSSTTGLLVIGGSNTKASINNPFNGQIYEIIMYLDHPSEAERLAIEGYLAHKWGIDSSLRASDGGDDHTYEDLPPVDGITFLGETIANETMDRSLIGDMSSPLNMVDGEHGGWIM